MTICEYEAKRGYSMSHTYHDDTRRLRCTTYAWNRKELNESSEEIPLGGNPRFFDEDLLRLKLCMNVIELASSLKRRVSKAKQRFVCLGVSSLGHEPSEAVC